MRYMMLCLVAVALTACQTPSQLEVTRNTAYICASAAAALNVANDNRARISAANQARITRAVNVINPICSQQTPPTLDSTAHAALSSALAELTAASQP